MLRNFTTTLELKHICSRITLFNSYQISTCKGQYTKDRHYLLRTSVEERRLAQLNSDQ